MSENASPPSMRGSSPKNPWILAARPKTLPAALAPVVIGTGMAHAAGALHWPSAFACLACALLVQVATNFWNDYADFRRGADTGERLGPTRATQAGLISPAAMRAAALITFALTAAVSLYLCWRASWLLAIVGAASIASGILYTGGPRPLGYLGLGEAFVLVFFGPVAVGGTYYAQALHLPPEVIVSGLAPGLLATAILVVNNLRDLETDARAGKRTLAVRFGAAFARAEYVICIAGAAAVPPILVAMTGGHHAALAACGVVLAAVPAAAAVFTKRGRALNATLGHTALALLLYSVLFTAGWLA